MSTIIVSELKHKSRELLDEYQQTPSNEIRNKLVQLNIGLVRKEVHHWQNQCNESYDDLLQVGCIGLIRAIERFDVSRANSFSSFAIPYIRGEIQHYLRDKSPSVRIPRQWLIMQKQAGDLEQVYLRDQGRKPTDSEIASALHISVDEWREIKLAGQNRLPLSLDTPVVDENDCLTCLGDVVPDAKYRSFQLAQEDQIRLQQGLAKLEEQTRKILEFVFLYDLTQKQTAEKLGLSTVTVSRRVKKGLDALRHIMIGNDQ